MNTEYIGVPEKTGVFSVVGCDTFYGARMRKHLCEPGKRFMALGGRGVRSGNGSPVSKILLRPLLIFKSK